eukprot:293398_1
MHYYGYLDDEYIHNKSITGLKIYALQLVKEHEPKYEEALIKSMMNILCMIYNKLIQDENSYLTTFFEEEIDYFDLNINWIQYLIKVNQYIFDEVFDFITHKDISCDYINHINVLTKSDNINLFKILSQFIHNESNNEYVDDISFLTLNKSFEKIKNYKQIGITRICDEAADTIVSSKESIIELQHTENAIKFVSYLIRQYLTFFSHLTKEYVCKNDFEYIEKHLTSIFEERNLFINISHFIELLMVLHSITNNNLSSLFAYCIAALKSKQFDESLSYILQETLSGNESPLILKQSTMDLFTQSLQILKDIFKQKNTESLETQFQAKQEQLKPTLVKVKVIGDCVRFRVVCHLFIAKSHTIVFSTNESDIINNNNLEQREFENDTYYNIKCLQEQTEYYFQVKSLFTRADSFTIDSNIIKIETGQVLIPTISTLKPYYNTTKLELSFSTNHIPIICNATEYKEILTNKSSDVIIKTDDEKYEIKEQIEYQEFASNLLLIKNLKPNTQYAFRVRTKFDQKDWFKYSNYETFTTSNDKNYLRVIHFAKFTNLKKSSRKCEIYDFDNTDGFDCAEIGCPGKHALSAPGMNELIRRQIQKYDETVSISCDSCHSQPKLDWTTCAQIADLTEKENAHWSQIMYGRKRKLRKTQLRMKKREREMRQREMEMKITKEPFSVAIRGSNGKHCMVHDLKSTQTLRYLKQKYCDFYGGNRIDLSFIHRGNLLHDDSKTLADYNISNNSVLAVIFRTCGGCFVNGTNVLLSNMEKIKIEDINIGDNVLTYSLNEKKIVPSRVNSVLKFEVNELVTITFENAVSVVCTPSHPFYVANKDSWCSVNNVKYGKLYIGDHVMNHKSHKFKITNIVYKYINDGCITVRTLSVEGNNHNYFANDILVHNKTMK